MSGNQFLDTRRHMELFDPDKFQHKINIIGAGATGSWLALIFAKLGIKGEQIKVWDFDTVEEHNIPNQAYELGQVGKPKVEALQELIKQQTNTEIQIVNSAYQGERMSGYVFMMVDSMETRRKLWESSIKMKTSIKLLIEPRMGLDLGRIYTVQPINMADIRAYEQNFYSDEEAEVSACGTSMTVITTAMGVASFCARAMINDFNGEEPIFETIIDFKYNNIVTTTL